MLLAVVLSIALGLYGDNFYEASKDALTQGIVQLQPPTKSNIIAMVAPWSGGGVYTERQVRCAFILESRFTFPEWLPSNTYSL